jgi:hypothetical protein
LNPLQPEARTAATSAEDLLDTIRAEHSMITLLDL